MVTWQDERTLDESDLDPDPHTQFRVWLQAAIDAGEPMPTAMAVATSSPDGVASVRMILLEEVDARGFVFQTSLESPKARDLAANPRAAVTFFWPGLLRQVRASGQIEPLSRAEVAALYAAAPTTIQAMLRACHQGQVIPDRATLERNFAAALAAADTGVPSYWGGYRLILDWIEFWQGRQNWLQDRLRVTRVGERWQVQRLAP